MMKTNTNKLGHARGFTLIELLVVIAVIGILASVVLASLNTARDKGADATVKSNLQGIRNQMSIFYDGNGVAYTGGCTTDANVVSAMASAMTAVAITPTVGGLGDGECVDTDTTWAAWVNLRASDAYYCVDSTGIAVVTATRIDSTAVDLTACP